MRRSRLVRRSRSVIRSIVVQPARVVEQLANGYVRTGQCVAGADLVGQQALHGVVESQPVLGDELQDDRRGERLCDAPGAELQVRCHRRADGTVGDAGRAEAVVRAASGEQESAWVGVRVGHHLVDQRLQGRVTTAVGRLSVTGLARTGHTG